MVVKISILTRRIRILDKEYGAAISWPYGRFEINGNDIAWDEENGTWSLMRAIVEAGGGKLKNPLIVVAGKKIYFEAY